jgi:hypothetical protein
MITKDIIVIIKLGEVKIRRMCAGRKIHATTILPTFLLSLLLPALIHR